VSRVVEIALDVYQRQSASPLIATSLDAQAVYLGVLQGTIRNPDATMEDLRQIVAEIEAIR
jgi:hypothetical protein